MHSMKLSFALGLPLLAGFAIVSPAARAHDATPLTQAQINHVVKHGFTPTVHIIGGCAGTRYGCNPNGTVRVPPELNDLVVKKFGELFGGK